MTTMISSKLKRGVGKKVRNANAAPEILARLTEGIPFTDGKEEGGGGDPVVPSVEAFSDMIADTAAADDAAARYAEALVAYLVRTRGDGPISVSDGVFTLPRSLCGRSLPFLVESLLILGRHVAFAKVAGGMLGDDDEWATWPDRRSDDVEGGGVAPWEVASALGAAWQALISHDAIIEAVHHVWKVAEQEGGWPENDAPVWAWLHEVIHATGEWLTKSEAGSGLTGEGSLCSADFQAALAKLRDNGAPAKLRHPLAPLVRQWLRDTAREAKPFRPKTRASLPRFEKTKLHEARLLSDSVAEGPEQFELLHTEDVVDSCPTWLLGMFRRAVSVRTGRSLGSTRSGMPWSFTLAIGGVAHYAIPDRKQWAPFGRDLPFVLDEIIGWLHPRGWGSRRRDWHRLDEAFEETPSYRVTVDGIRYSVVTAYGLPEVYSPSARVKLNVRVPPSAAHGARFDWLRYHVTYSKRATLQRALLATAGLLDRTAHHGNPLTRMVREHEVDADGKPKRERIIGKDGKPKRDKQGRDKTRPVFTGQLVPNPLLGELRPALLPDKHLALFLGMANTRTNRHDAKAALETLQHDAVIDLERVPNGYRIFGPAPKAPKV